MASIGRTKHNICEEPGCWRRRPYWASFCKQHRIKNNDLNPIMEKALIAKLAAEKEKEN